MKKHSKDELAITGVDLNDGDEIIVNLSDGTTLEIKLHQLLSLRVTPTPEEPKDFAGDNAQDAE